MKHPMLLILTIALLDVRCTDSVSVARRTTVAAESAHVSTFQTLQHKHTQRAHRSMTDRSLNYKSLDLSDLNMCEKGRLLPELYLIGAQKAGTSTFSVDFENAGIAHVGDWKELHFFDKDWNGTAGSGSEDEMSLEKNAWLTHLSPCPTDWQGTGIARRVTADFTPSNLRSIPLPNGTLPTGSHWGLWFLHYGSDLQKLADAPKEPMSVPRVLRFFYGENSDRLQFVVMLREGLARMQSAWYSAATTDDVDKTLWQQCSDCEAPDFRTAFNRTMQKTQQTPPIYDDWLWASMYARHLEAWTSWFDPSQFNVIPFRDYVIKGYKKDICEDLMRKFRYEDGNCSRVVAMTRDNAHDHPEASNDIGDDLRIMYEGLMQEENLRLVRVLALMYQKGSNLVGFTGSGREDEVSGWLANGW